MIKQEEVKLVRLPDYKKENILILLNDSDFEKNYLHYITCFNLNKHLKLITKRIYDNFKNNKFIELTFDLLEEIGGRNKNLIKIADLLDALSNINIEKYKMKIIDALQKEVFWAKFGLTKNYKNEFIILKKFKTKKIHDKINFKDYSTIGSLLVEACIMHYYNDISNDIFKTDTIFSFLHIENRKRVKRQLIETINLLDD